MDTIFLRYVNDNTTTDGHEPRDGRGFIAERRPVTPCANESFLHGFFSNVRIRSDGKSERCDATDVFPHHGVKGVFLLLSHTSSVSLTNDD